MAQSKQTELPKPKTVSPSSSERVSTARDRQEVASAETYDPAPEQRILFFDLETIRSAADVGGWHNVPEMGLAVGVVYDSQEKAYLRYWEQDAAVLVEKLLSADLVVGFNHIRFDYAVLAAYTNRNLAAEAKSFDILLDVWDRLGHRLSLDHLSKATLGASKTADGLQSLQWWADGLHDKVAAYCEADVILTKELFEYGLNEQRLIYTHKSGEPVAIPLHWDLDEIIRKEAERTKTKQRRIQF
jgi:DEAD/DEAH box helicase domain-containing protein